MGTTILQPAVKTANNQKARILTLNNPQSLNALNRAMIDILLPQLEVWQKLQGVAVLSTDAHNVPQMYEVTPSAISSF